VGWGVMLNPRCYYIGDSIRPCRLRRQGADSIPGGLCVRGVVDLTSPTD
jgi:hypothetical protein